jgi:hypothetical protein
MKVFQWRLLRDLSRLQRVIRRGDPGKAKAMARQMVRMYWELLP